MPRNRAGSIDQDYKYFMAKIAEDPIAGGQEYLRRLQQSPKLSPGAQKTMLRLERMLADPEDTSEWQRGSGVRSITDAIGFVVSNSLLNKEGIGVVHVGPREDIVNTVANMISEDVDFTKWTPIQRRLKIIAESYGYFVYQLPEERLVY